DHFTTLHGEIIAKTRIGEASIKIFRLNQPDLLIIRQILSESRRYP
ncbi:MAG: HNH endonuclease, partial [Runella slithyformis]